MRSDRHLARRDAGMVTAELAACLPVLVVLLAVALTALTAVSARLRAEDAAREAARADARGDRAAVAGLVRQAAPGAQVALSRSADTVRAVVRVRVRPLGGVVPGFSVTASAVAAREPTGAAP